MLIEVCSSRFSVEESQQSGAGGRSERRVMGEMRELREMRGEMDSQEGADTFAESGEGSARAAVMVVGSVDSEEMVSKARRRR